MTDDRAVIVLADMLAAAADDSDYPLSRYTAARLAARAVELLELAGWELVHSNDLRHSPTGET